MAHQVPEGYYFTEKHEWAREADGLLWIGISDYAQDSLGDIVYLDIPDAGTSLATGDSFGNIESVKAVEDLYAPAGGTIAETNTAIKDGPEQINADAYGSWLIKLKDYSADDLGKLMDSAAYGEFLKSLE
ncbi:MAG: glycine cleavage system protein GcvH [bacterium]|nr:glycine cleavage system protein GcvH [bacterium]